MATLYALNRYHIAPLGAGTLLTARAVGMIAVAGAAITGLGMGLSVPASNNASPQPAPDQVAAIAGLRGMFRQSGAIIAVSVTTAIIACSGHPGLDQAHVFIVFAFLLIALLPLIRLVPDQHGNW